MIARTGQATVKGKLGAQVLRVLSLLFALLGTCRVLPAEEEWQQVRYLIDEESWVWRGERPFGAAAPHEPEEFHVLGGELVFDLYWERGYLRHLFSGRELLPPPFRECGVDATRDSLDCRGQAPCGMGG